MGNPTHFTFMETYKFFNRKPGPVTPILTLAYPFNGVVWAYVLASFTFVLAAIYLINLKRSLDLFSTVHVVLSCIVSDSLPSHLLSLLKGSWYGCVVLIIWFMCGLLLSAAYSSNLLASLLVVEMEVPDDTIQVSRAICSTSQYQN